MSGLALGIGYSRFIFLKIVFSNFKYSTVSKPLLYVAGLVECPPSRNKNSNNIVSSQIETYRYKKLQYTVS